MKLKLINRKHIRKFVIPVFVIVTISSCVSSPRTSQAELPSNNKNYQNLVLNGEDISESDFGSIKSWRCKDYINGGRTVVEVGHFSDSDLNGVGFVLYDNTNSGEVTSYERKGVNHRWDWGPNGYEYAFVIKTDGVGYFYDFSVLSDEGTASANDLFKCTS